MSVMDEVEHKRVVWMTAEQRDFLRLLVTDALVDVAAFTDEVCDDLHRVAAELDHVQQRRRISGRLVRAHVTGLMLPHDALPVKVTDREATTILTYLPDIHQDRTLARVLKPGPLKQGRR